MVVDTDWLLVDQHAIALVNAGAWTANLSDAVSNDIDELLWRHGYRMQVGYVATPTVRKLATNYALRALFQSCVGIRDAETDAVYTDLARRYDSEFFACMRTLTYTNIAGDE